MTLSFDYPLWLLALATIGGIVVFLLGVFVLLIIYHIVHGLVIACSYMRWSFRVMKVNGRKPVWRRFFSTFGAAWWRGIGYVNDGSEIIRKDRSWWKGMGDYLVFEEAKSQFVDNTPPPDNWHDDDDLIDDDDEFYENDMKEARRNAELSYAHTLLKDMPERDHIQDVIDEDDGELNKMTAGGKRVTSLKDIRDAKRSKRK